MNDLPRRAITRTAKLATLPVGLAGRTALGLGKRLGGRPAELVAAEIQHRTADQIFRVLGELKGGAMKFGQALSIFEAALPPEIAGPYRATLTKLQESAPPLPTGTVHRVLREDLGPDWREAFAEFNDKPAAAASIGQVHRARWRDGREVAVKIQYPGAGRALLSDFNQLSRVARLFAVLMPGLEVRPLLDELRARVAEELDYHLEAESQHAFAVAYADDPDIFVPDVVAGTSHVLITEWIDGTPLSKIISDGSQEERDHAGLLFARFLFSGPARAGLLHADPHPGNFRLLADGRLGVLDFGAVDRLPDGLPPFMGRLLRIVHEGSDLGPAEQELREQGFIREGIEFDPEALSMFLAPLAEPSRVERFKFSREWLRGEATRVADPRAANISRRLNLPPSYVLIHRVSTAGMGVLCQLESEGPYRAEMIRWMPGYSDAGQPADEPAAAEVTAAEVTAAEVTAAEVTAAGVTAGELVTDESAADEITTAEEITAGKLAASGLTANGLSLNGLPRDGLAAKELTAMELTAKGLPPNGLTAKELTVQELTANELTAEQLIAEELAAEELASGELTAEELAPGELTAEELASGEPAAQELAPGELTAQERAPGEPAPGEPAAGEPAAGAAAGPGEPDPVGPAR
ncbi:MAG TPA: AarF/ABC1/UbiB kinase family protein [Streptosporangiaceae bacterium]|nr:AarF/ABC1/UbiB kinase family protein [Streptosporangiaceae bacterium]